MYRLNREWQITRQEFLFAQRSLLCEASDKFKLLSYSSDLWSTDYPQIIYDQITAAPAALSAVTDGG